MVKVSFAKGIRGHWGIENRLHWGGSAVGGFPDLRRLPFKDVIFNEDHSTIRKGNAPANLSVLRTMPSARLRQRTQYLAPKWLFLHHLSPDIYL
ncbi:hypothetical protein [Nostoc sp.]|uniref:hypothetical protein n=1 Tax=Nostoc sp. TaxID=1180 RepID=UPI002FFB4CAB